MIRQIGFSRHLTSQFFFTLSFVAMLSTSSAYAGSCYSVPSSQSYEHYCSEDLLKTHDYRQDFFKKETDTEVEKYATAGDLWAKTEFARRMSLKTDKPNIDEALKLLDEVMDDAPREITYISAVGRLANCPTKIYYEAKRIAESIQPR